MFEEKSREKFFCPPYPRKTRMMRAESKAESEAFASRNGLEV